MDLQPSTEYRFLPPRRGGNYFYLGAILILVGAAFFGLYGLSQAQIGLVFLLQLLPILLAAILIPILIYQMYALQRAVYILGRDGVRLRWGLRVENIPITEVLWILNQDEWQRALPLPVLNLPGTAAGMRRLPDSGKTNNPQLIEYMASRTRRLVLIGTPKKIYAISPADPNAFIYTFHRLTELGSIAPLAPRSDFPTFLLAQVWAAPVARYLIAASLLLSLALFIWVSLAIPSRTEVHLGFYPDGSPGDLAPAVQLLLLPVLNGIIIVTNLVIGLFFFRRSDVQEITYILWGSSVVIPILFLIGTYFILQTG